MPGKNAQIGLPKKAKNNHHSPTAGSFSPNAKNTQMNSLLLSKNASDQSICVALQIRLLETTFYPPDYSFELHYVRTPNIYNIIMRPDTQASNQTSSVTNQSDQSVSSSQHPYTYPY